MKTRNSQPNNSEFLQLISSLILKLFCSIQLLWRWGNPKSANPILHSVWANFQTSRTNVKDIHNPPCKTTGHYFLCIDEHTTFAEILSFYYMGHWRLSIIPFEHTILAGKIALFRTSEVQLLGTGCCHFVLTVTQFMMHRSFLGEDGDIFWVSQSYGSEWVALTFPSLPPASGKLICRCFFYSHSPVAFLFQPPVRSSSSWIIQDVMQT